MFIKHGTENFDHNGHVAEREREKNYGQFADPLYGSGAAIAFIDDWHVTYNPGHAAYNL